MTIISRILLGLLVFFLIVIITYLLGPRHPLVPFDANPIITNTDISQVESIIIAEESIYKLKPENEAQIVWYDGVKKTEYGFIYLHGWSASPGESGPISYDLAKRYGANLMLVRQPGHGMITDDALVDVTAKQQVDHVKKMIDLASKTCEKLIVLSVSTGSTFSSYLSSADDRIYAQVMMSPNFGLLDPAFKLVDKPWGLQLLRFVLGSKYNTWVPHNAEVKKYWYTTYRAEGLVVLGQILSNSMTTEIYVKINTPVYVAYFYENENKKDDIIDVSLIEPFAQAISTDPAYISLQAFTGDLRHVISNPLHNENYLEIQESIQDYLEQVLKLSVMHQDESTPE